MKVKDICEVYLSAIKRAELGEQTVSMDEMTGIGSVKSDCSKLIGIQVA